MKIAHVMRRLSFNDWGGTEQVVWNLAKAQMRAGHEVRIFATTALWKGLATKNAEDTKDSLSLSQSRGGHPGVANSPSKIEGVAGGRGSMTTGRDHTPPPCGHLPCLRGGVGDMSSHRLCGIANFLGSLCLKCKPYTETIDGIEILRFKPIYPWWPMPKSLVDELDRKGGNPFVPGLGKALRDWKPDVIHCHAMARIAELCLRTAKILNKQRVMRNGQDARCPSGSALNSQLSTPNSQLSTRCVISLHGGGANVPTAEAKSLKAPTRGRLPWGKLIDYAMGWTRRIPEDFDGIVCVGEDEAERYRVKHPHVLFLPNGVDTAIFEGGRVEKWKSGKVEERKGGKVVLCVARIDRQKNQMMLVEWLGRHPEATVRLVGPVTQPDYRDELVARAAALGVADRLVLVGSLKPGSPELVSEYRQADVFVLPSRHEPFGIVVLEAWAAGLPVVASDVGGLGRLCAAHLGAALTFAPDDAAGLEAALGKVHADAELRRNLSQAGARAAASFDWRNLAARLLGFYGELC